MDKKPQADKHKKYKKQKIDTYVSAEDKNRLDAICGKFGFRSTYQLMQYLIHCFLRVADPENDPIDTPLQNEIVEMFTDNADWEKGNHSFGSHKGMIMKKKPDQRRLKTIDDLKQKP